MYLQFSLFCRAGRCELYSGSSCKDYLKGKYVFIKRGDSQKTLETRISKWFQRGIFSSLISSILSPEPYERISGMWYI